MRSVSPRSRFLAAVAVLYAPWLFLGYGADSDVYGLVRAGRTLLTEGTYIGSRNPGYLIPEIGLGLLDLVGGSALSNAGSLVMALLGLGAFLSITDRLAVPHRFLLAAGLALHPVFWTSATSSIDHLWALGFFLMGWLALLDQRWVRVALLFALAVGSRLTLALAVASVLIYALYIQRYERRHVVAVGVVSAALGAACYLPPAHAAGWTLDFLTPLGLGGAELWTWPLRLGRWAYKNIYFWGLLGTLALAVPVVRAFALRERRPLLLLVAGVVLVYEALFLRYPLDPGYLLPTAPFVLLGAGVVLAERRRWLLALVVLIASYAVVNINLARPDRPFGATGASFGLWVEPGRLIQDTQIRWLVRDCSTSRCWAERMGVPME